MSLRWFEHLGLQIVIIIKMLLSEGAEQSTFSLGIYIDFLAELLLLSPKYFKAGVTPASVARLDS